MALGSLSLCQPGCVPLTAHCSLQWRLSSRALLEHISHLSPLTVTWASLGGHWVDSFQPKRKTNCSNSHNELHWLPGPQSKCLDWRQMDVTPSGPEPQHHSLDATAPLPYSCSAAWHCSQPPSPQWSCSALWGVGTGAPGYAHTGNPGQQGRKRGRDQFYCGIIKASSALILSNKGTRCGGGSLQCTLMQLPLSWGRGN